MLNWINKKRNRKGFTLVELVVVIAILAILAAIAIPRLGGFKDTAKAQANKQAAAQIKSAVAMAIAAGEFEANEGKTGEIEVVNGSEKKLSVQNVKKLTKTKDVVETVLQNYVEEFELQKLGKKDQMIRVTIDDTGVKADVIEKLTKQ